MIADFCASIGNYFSELPTSIFSQLRPLFPIDTNNMEAEIINKAPELPDDFYLGLRFEDN